MRYLDVFEKSSDVFIEDNKLKRKLKRVGVVWINRKGLIVLHLRNKKFYLFEPTFRHNSN